MPMICLTVLASSRSGEAFQILKTVISSCCEVVLWPTVPAPGAVCIFEIDGCDTGSLRIRRQQTDNRESGRTAEEKSTETSSIPHQACLKRSPTDDSLQAPKAVNTGANPGGLS